MGKNVLYIIRKLTDASSLNHLVWSNAKPKGTPKATDSYPVNG